MRNKLRLKVFRRRLRNNLTPAEAFLWNTLKGRKLDGRKFRRQYSVGDYILDFYCPEEKLAIELDGAGHFKEDQIKKDKNRDQFLETLGIKTLRFENRWVFENEQGVIQAIKDSFDGQNKKQDSSDHTL